MKQNTAEINYVLQLQAKKDLNTSRKPGKIDQFKTMKLLIVMIH